MEANQILDLPNTQIREKGYNYHQGEWANDKEINHSWKKYFQLNGNKSTTFSKRPVKEKLGQNGRAKRREETLRVLAAERDWILNSPTISHTTIVNPSIKKPIYIDNVLGYNHGKKSYIMH